MRIAVWYKIIMIIVVGHALQLNKLTKQKPNEYYAHHSFEWNHFTERQRPLPNSPGSFSEMNNTGK